MITEPAVDAVAVPPEISETIGSLQTQVEKLQRELAQALQVWGSTLAAEKEQFDGLLRHKELAWREQEEQWIRQTQAYQERLAAMQSEFESHVKLSEQNTTHALAELDDAWQRDKLEWGPAAEGEWPDQRRQLEAKTQVLELELSELRLARDEERKLYESRLQEMENRPNPGAGPTPSTVKALEEQLQVFQQTVASFQDRDARSDELVNACVQALDYQITVLYDLVHHYAEPASDDSSARHDQPQPAP